MRDDHGLFGELRARLQGEATQPSFVGIMALVRVLGDEALEYAVAGLDARWPDAARELTIRQPSPWHKRGELTWEDVIARPGLLRCARVVRLGWWNRPLAPPAFDAALWAARPARLAVSGEQALATLTALAAVGELGWLEELEVSEPDRARDARRGGERPSAAICALLAAHAHGLKRLSMPHTPWSPALLEALARGVWWEGLEALTWQGAMSGEAAKLVDALGALRPAALRALELSGSAPAAAVVDAAQGSALEALAAADVGLTRRDSARLAGLTSLRTLNLRGAEVGEEGMKRLLALPQLKRLEVDRREITTGVLLEALRRGRLEALWCDEHEAHPEQARGRMTYRALCGEGCVELGGLTLNRVAAHVLARSGYLTGARLVWLQDTGLGDEGLRALCAGANLWAARGLDVSGCGLTGAGVEVLGACEALRGLERLVVSENALGAEGLAGLGEAGRGLRVLEASAVGLKARGLAALSCCASRLERLVLEGNVLGDEAARWLPAEVGAQLMELDITHTGMSAAGVVALLEVCPALHYLHIDQSPQIDLDGFCAIRDALPSTMRYVSAAKLGAGEEALRAAWEARAARDCHAGFG